MSVIDTNKLDGIALTNDCKGVALLITDHLDWKDEYNHLILLQEKINSYISFFEGKQYEEILQKKDITYGIIEIHFMYDLTGKAEQFLQVVKKNVKEIGIEINYEVAGLE